MDKKQIKTLVIAAAVLLAVIVGGVYVYTQKEAQIKSLATEKSELYQQMVSKDSVLNDMENTFAEIENNLTFIKEKRSNLSIDNQEGVTNQKQELVADIALMNTMLDTLSGRLKEIRRYADAAHSEIAGLSGKMAEGNASPEEVKGHISETVRSIEILRKSLSFFTLDKG